MEFDIYDALELLIQNETEYISRIDSAISFLQNLRNRKIIENEPYRLKISKDLEKRFFALSEDSQRQIPKNINMHDSLFEKNLCSYSFSLEELRRLYLVMSSYN